MKGCSSHSKIKRKVKRADVDSILTKFIDGANIIREYKYDMKKEKLMLVTEKVNESFIDGVLSSVSSIAKVLMFRKAVC